MKRVNKMVFTETEVKVLTDFINVCNEEEFDVYDLLNALSNQDETFCANYEDIQIEVVEV